MSETRIESAVNRIEAALARIAELADNPPAATPSVSALVIKHEALREVANSALAELDTLIDEMDR